MYLKKIQFIIIRRAYLKLKQNPFQKYKTLAKDGPFHKYRQTHMKENIEILQFWNRILYWNAGEK